MILNWVFFVVVVFFFVFFLFFFGQLWVSSKKKNKKKKKNKQKKEKYNRTAKFKLKYDLNYAVKITAETLSQAESDFQQAQMYTELAQKAGYEQKRYLTAIERINFFKENKTIYSGYNKPNVIIH